MQEPCRLINPWMHLNLFLGEFSLLKICINLQKQKTYVIFSIKFAEVECNINIQNAEPIHDSKDADSNFASANETLARNEW